MRRLRPRCAAVLAAVGGFFLAAPLLRAGEPAAKEPTPAELAKTIEALKARLRAQEARIAELEKTQSRLVRREEVRKLVDEVVDALGPSDFRLYWDNGVRARTGDGRLAMKFGGRLMYDWTWADGGGVEPHFAGSGFDLEDITDGTSEERRAPPPRGSPYGSTRRKKTSRFPPAPRRGEGVSARSARPASAAWARTRARTASRCSSGTTPPRRSDARASYCGLTRARTRPPGAKSRRAAGRMCRIGVQPTSTVTTATGSGSRTCRAFVRSMTTTRGSFRNRHASVP